MAETSATWFRVELDSSERFIEVEMSGDTADAKRANFKRAILGPEVVKVLRQVIAMPHREKGQNMLAFARIEQVSPLLAGCDGPDHINLGRVVSFSLVDERSEMWCAVKERALNEPSIVTPPKGLVIPK